MDTPKSSSSKLGFSNEQVHAIRPGIVCATLNAFGHTGAWRMRRGFDTVVQSASAFTNTSLCAQDMTLGSLSLMSALGERVGVTSSQAPSRFDTADLCGSPVPLRDQQW